jgi:hypothetical protein
MFVDNIKEPDPDPLDSKCNGDNDDNESELTSVDSI